MDVLINPIVLSVLALCALCLCRLNVLVSLIIAAIIAGMSGSLGITKSMTVLANGFSGNATTALSYILLGTFAVAIAQTGLMQILVNWLNRHLATRPMTFCFAIAAIRKVVSEALERSQKCDHDHTKKKEGQRPSQTKVLSMLALGKQSDSNKPRRLACLFVREFFF